MTLASFLFLILSSMHQYPNDAPRGTIILPVMGATITSPFGIRRHPITHRPSFHSGVDLSAYENAPLRTVGAGVVIFAGNYLGYGNLIVIKHAGGFTSHYAHCKAIIVSVGQNVVSGELIGAIGATGRATGPHLHFEIRKQGVPIDPLVAIPSIKNSPHE